MYSRGSVLSLFVEQLENGKPITITNPNMTRFMLPLPIAIDLVLFTLNNARNGDILVRKAPASTIGDIAKSMLEIFNSNIIKKAKSYFAKLAEDGKELKIITVGSKGNDQLKRAYE